MSNVGDCTSQHWVCVEKSSARAVALFIAITHMQYYLYMVLQDNATYQNEKHLLLLDTIIYAVAMNDDDGKKSTASHFTKLLLYLWL